MANDHWKRESSGRGRGVTISFQNKHKEGKKKKKGYGILGVPSRGGKKKEKLFRFTVAHQFSSPRTSGDLPESVLAPTSRRPHAAPPGSATDFFRSSDALVLRVAPFTRWKWSIAALFTIPNSVMGMATWKLHVTVSAAPGLAHPKPLGHSY